MCLIGTEIAMLSEVHGRRVINSKVICFESFVCETLNDISVVVASWW
jgi:hypothetical protein